MSNNVSVSQTEEAAEGPRRVKSKNSKKHRRRVRGAWIGFVGRIVAQFVGSAASIVLTLTLVGKYQPGGRLPHETAAQATTGVPAAFAQSAPSASPAAPLVIVLPPAALELGVRRDGLSAATLSARDANTGCSSVELAERTRAAWPRADAAIAHPDLQLARTVDRMSDGQK